MVASFVDLSYPVNVTYAPDSKALKSRFLYNETTKYSIVANDDGTLTFQALAANGEGVYYPELIRTHIYTRTVWGQPRRFQLFDAEGKERISKLVQNDVIVIFSKAIEVQNIELVLYDEGAIVYRAKNLLDNVMIFS